MKKIKIFLASSYELKADREQFEIAIYRKCKNWIDKGVFLHLEIWEDLSAKLTRNGMQDDEYNQKIKEADLFVLLAHNKVGEFTLDEFEVAFNSYHSKQKPFVFTYFKASSYRKKTLTDFQNHLKNLKHYYSAYTGFDSLWVQFNNELERLESEDFKQFVFDSKAVTQTRINITQGDKSVYIENNNGDINIS